MNYPSITRRDFLQKASIGFGGLALAGLYGAPVIPHYRPRAKNVIFLFMEGGVSVQRAYRKGAKEISVKLLKDSPVGDEIFRPPLKVS